MILRLKSNTPDTANKTWFEIVVKMELNAFVLVLGEMEIEGVYNKNKNTLGHVTNLHIITIGGGYNFCLF